MNNLLQKQIKLNCILGLSVFMGCGLLYNKDKILDYLYSRQNLVIYNNWAFHDEVLRYICVKHDDKINSFNYSVEKIYHFNEWRFRRKEKPVDLKVNMPNDCNITIYHQGLPIHIKYMTIKDDKNVPYKLMSTHDCCTEEDIVTMIELTGQSKALLTSFVDEANKWCEEEKIKIKSCSKETMNIYYFKKDYWTLLSKSPKRPSSTVYLKEGLKDNIMNNVSKFFSQETRDIYLSFGIPYKSVQLVHGPPGTGKTSLIKSIASDLDCDLYILPISKDMLDTNLVDAFSYISDNEEKERIIVIEDIDTLFDGERKKDDNSNGITLQAFLNCLDGFTCVEGTMLFLTANKPEVLDFAMIRSCRIDNKISLDYADKYQTECMFSTFLPEQKDKFKDFYKEVSHKKFTTAMIQEFLFYNRECENILEILDEFIDIIDKNDPKNFEVIKEENKNFYS
jgi:ATP-dependent 26S proteasome regulatory subunit